MCEQPANREPTQEDGQVQKATLTDKKRNALLRYMAMLFGVAFLLVLLSFLIQMRDSRQTISDLNQSNASALQNAGKLQEENQMLTAANAELQEQLDQAQAAMGDLQDLERQAADLEQALTEAQEQLAAADQRSADTQAAYDLLMSAQAAADSGDTDALKDALSQLAPLETALSDAAKAQYHILQGSLTAEG